MHMQNIRLKVLLVPAIATLSLAGCMVGPRYHRPDATPQPPPPSYKESPTQVQDPGPWKVAQPQDAMLRGKWWEIYNDPELNGLEEQLNINNQNIKQFFENFMAARALVAQAHSQLYPTIGTTPSISRAQSSGNLRKFHADHWNGNWLGRNDGRAAIFSFFASRRRYVGARSVGQDSQPDSCSSIQCSAERR